MVDSPSTLSYKCGKCGHIKTQTEPLNLNDISVELKLNHKTLGDKLVQCDNEILMYVNCRPDCRLLLNRKPEFVRGVTLFNYYVTLFRQK